MALQFFLVAVCLASSLSVGAADGHLVNGVKWRGCYGGFAANVVYITGEDVTYSASWAAKVERNALLNAGADLEAACAALVQEDQIGEIYVVTQENDPGCQGTCYRMAIYPEKEAGKSFGTVAGDSENWVCGAGVPPPELPECLVNGVKWRACKGYATNVAYITGQDVTYAASWAAKVERSGLLNASADLETACKDLLEAGQVGEIYVVTQENDPGCVGTCYRMAVYPEAEAGMAIGTVEGDSENWVCGYRMAPPMRPGCPMDMTCGEVKDAYKASKCCGNPTASFDASASRRLSMASDAPRLLSHVGQALKHAKTQSHAEASALAKELKLMAQQYDI